MTNKDLIEQVREIKERDDKIAELKSRLEMDWIYNHRGEKEPWQEGMPDAIDCRNQTIKTLEENNKRLLEKLQIAREALRNINYHADLLNEVTTAPDFSSEEKYMQLGNLLQSCEDGARALREMESLTEKETPDDQ